MTIELTLVAVLVDENDDSDTSGGWISVKLCYSIIRHHYVRQGKSSTNQSFFIHVCRRRRSSSYHKNSHHQKN